MELFKISLVVILLGISLYTDLKNNQVKNVVNYPFWVLGIMINMAIGGTTGALSALLGILFPIIILWVLFLLGMLGAGDIKLFSAVGAIMGGNFILKAIVTSFLSGGIIALFILIIRRRGRQRFRYLLNYLRILFLSGKLPHYTDENCHEGKFPFAIAIATGVMATLIGYY